jgi:hypothetical protein
LDDGRRDSEATVSTGDMSYIGPFIVINVVLGPTLAVVVLCAEVIVWTMWQDASFMSWTGIGRLVRDVWPMAMFVGFLPAVFYTLVMAVIMRRTGNAKVILWLGALVGFAVVMPFVVLILLPGWLRDGALFVLAAGLMGALSGIACAFVCLLLLEPHGRKL